MKESKVTVETELILHRDIEKDYPDYLQDESRRQGCAEAICFPANTEEVVQALKTAAQHAWAVTLQGARTGITAGAVPDGGLIVSLDHMKKMRGLRVSQDGNYLLRIEPGVSLDVLQHAVLHKSFDTNGWDAKSLEVLHQLQADSGAWFFSPDPTETTATLGGMVACNASGARSLLYGSVRPHVMGLEVVLAGGERLELERGRDRCNGFQFAVKTDAGRIFSGTLPQLKVPVVSKSAAGYYVRPDMDLLDALIGSEGTLGVVTEITVQLLPLPNSIWGVVVFFENEAEALGVLRQVRATDFGAVQVAAIEFFGCNALELLRKNQAAGQFGELPVLDAASHTGLYFEFHGATDDAVGDAVMLLCELLEAAGGDPDRAWVADTPKERERLRIFRHAVPESVNQLIAERIKTEPALTKLGTDMAVPDAWLDRTLQMYRRDLEVAQLEYVIFGHIGNNHLHVNILPRNEADYVEGKRLYRSWAESVTACGGTVAAEHGIGRLKRDFLRVMLGDAGIDQLRMVKRCFDPSFQLNPERIF